MSKSNEDFKPEIEEAEYQQDFCDCSHCQEAEEEYHQELEDEYQEDILSDEADEYDGFDEWEERVEIENRQRMREHWEDEEARQIYEEKHKKASQEYFLREEINDCLRKYIELGKNPLSIDMIHFCILNFVSKAMIQFNESNKN